MKIIILLCTLTFFVSCGNNTQNNNPKNDRLDLIPESDKGLREAYEKNKVKASGKKQIEEPLAVIRANFSKINNISDWSSIKKVELMESTEGGEADFYFQEDSLRKIVVHTYGETFQRIREYYLLDGQLSFVFTKHYNYNRPIYWDSISIKEFDDDEVFDMDKSEIIEERNYFQDGMLIKHIDSLDPHSPTAKSYHKDTAEEIVDRFRQVLELLSK